ncbi:unnamed protein product [Leptidea sinapis]|uniref:Uncharacterized protein n=1 Tax=Leptidea sinapis TaxID=189913 RepID=A0A5E4PSB0_9NEOP|nr:unnamed protein product [Leptidea sinapis]
MTMTEMEMANISHISGKAVTDINSHVDSMLPNVNWDNHFQDLKKSDNLEQGVKNDPVCRCRVSHPTS